MPAANRVGMLYQEQYRPQFHFTARTGWLNDPNGLIYYRGEYHLFFQHNPHGTQWGNMTWGHAVSDDLLHWRQLDHALLPDALGMTYSGSAVIDREDTAGFGRGALICAYTAAGQPFTQCLAYSHDGLTLTKYAGNPVLPHLPEDVEGNRDPRIFWHAESGQWIMALYVGVGVPGREGRIDAVYFFASPDLKAWRYLSTFPGMYECPELFELPVEGESEERRWVLFGGDGEYVVGQFDLEGFRREPGGGKHRLDWGNRCYAGQTFNEIPAEDGRRIFIAWMRGGSYPEMPFNQQMTFPCTLILRRTADGLRLFRAPVREVETLRTRTHTWDDLPLVPDINPLAGLQGELFDLEVEFSPGSAREVRLIIRGEAITYDAATRRLTHGDSTADLWPVDDRIQLRLLIDRTSIETFANDGARTISRTFLPPAEDRRLALQAEGGKAMIHRLRVHELQGAL